MDFFRRISIFLHETFFNITHADVSKKSKTKLCIKEKEKD